MSSDKPVPVVLPIPLPAIDPSRINLIVLAGPCLSGKTELTGRALSACQQRDVPMFACSVDDLFTFGGSYRFDAEKAPLAHCINQLTVAKHLFDLSKGAGGVVIVEQCVTNAEELVIFRLLARHFRAVLYITQTVLPLMEVPKGFRCVECGTKKPRINDNSNGKAFVFADRDHRDNKPSTYCNGCAWRTLDQRTNVRVLSARRTLVPLLRSMINRQLVWAKEEMTFESEQFETGNAEVMEFVSLLEKASDYELVIEEKKTLFEDYDCEHSDNVLREWRAMVAKETA